VIQPADIERLVGVREQTRESVGDWCRRNGVDESVIHRLLELYGWDRRSGIAALDAFRTGHEARRADEPRGECSAGWVVGGDRYAVQLVVVDTASGVIVGDATSNSAGAVDLAETYNRVDSETATKRRL
jgi:hypothetical protein